MHERKAVVAADAEGANPLKACVVLGLTALTVLLCWLAPAPQAGGEAGVLMQLPDQVGDFHGLGFTQEPTVGERYLLPPDTTFAKSSYETLKASGDDRIYCSIVLSGQEKRSIHRPERCLPSQGWRIEGSQTVTVPLASGRSLKAIALLLDRPEAGAGGVRQAPQSYFVYWFVGKDVTTPYYFVHILLTNWDMLVHRVNQRWAYIYVQSDITQGIDPQGRNAEQTLDMLKRFIHDSVPYYMKSEMPDAAAASR